MDAGKGELIGMENSKTKQIYKIPRDRKDKLCVTDRKRNRDLYMFKTFGEDTDFQLRTMMTRTLYSFLIVTLFYGRYFCISVNYNKLISLNNKRLRVFSKYFNKIRR